MVVAYSIMGGFIFKALEAPHEEQVKHDVIEFKQDKIDKIWQEANLLSCNESNRAAFVTSVAEVFVQVGNNNCPLCEFCRRRDDLRVIV